MKKLTCFFLFWSCLSIAQSEIDAYVYDETSTKALPYATVYIVGTKLYTITNEDGKFSIPLSNEVSLKDTLEIRFYGYTPLKRELSYFLEHDKILMTPSISNLEEVYITTDKKEQKDRQNEIAKTLFSVIKKYRKRHTTTESKAFLSLTSSVKDIPLEQIEGFYNSEQSLARGMPSLALKNGRFGQNRAFPFYSINNTEILTNFHLFENSEQILPKYPGNMNLSQIKNTYQLEFDVCLACSSNDIKISFAPKSDTGKFFSGYIIFDATELIVKKIRLNSHNPRIEQLTSIVADDVIAPKEIGLEVAFSPLDLTKIQSYNFKLVLNYRSNTINEDVTSNSFLYFFDFDTPFNLPYYTAPVAFNNDYDKIIAQQASEGFWETNYQYPKSIAETVSLEYMKQYGYLINYSNDIPLDYLNYINPAVVSWRSDKRLNWSSIKASDVADTNDNSSVAAIDTFNEAQTINADEVSHSISGMNKGQKSSLATERLFFCYVLDSYEDMTNSTHMSSRTIFNRNSSYYNSYESDQKLVYINIMFDIYEYYRQKTENNIASGVTFDTAIKAYDLAFQKAEKLVKQMKKETSNGENFQQLVLWNSELNKKLGIDNFKIITTKEK